MSVVKLNSLTYECALEQPLTHSRGYIGVIIITFIETWSIRNLNAHIEACLSVEIVHIY